MKGVAIAAYTLAVICQSFFYPGKVVLLTDVPRCHCPQQILSLGCQRSRIHQDRYPHFVSIKILHQFSHADPNSISITGFVVLGGNVSAIPDPNANFRNAFEGTTDNGNDLSTALVNIVFSYTGYANAFSVVNEVKKPVPTIKKYGFISVVLVAVLYMLCNVAYFAAGQLFLCSKTSLLLIIHSPQEGIRRIERNCSGCLLH
jgi:hypothetical protein